MAEPKIPEMIPLGDLVREKREQKELRQLDVATEAGVGVQFMGRLERGERDSGILRLSRVCRTLGITSEEFLRQITLGEEMVAQDLDPSTWREYLKAKSKP